MSDSLATDSRHNLRISPYVTEAGLTAELRRAGIFRYDFEYVKDREFERYALSGLDTMDKVHSFLDSLDRGADRRYPFSVRPKTVTCVKASQARAWLANGFCTWMEPSRAARGALAAARRVNCGCHQRCSFAPKRPRW